MHLLCQRRTSNNTLAAPLYNLVSKCSRTNERRGNKNKRGGSSRSSQEHISSSSTPRQQMWHVGDTFFFLVDVVVFLVAACSLLGVFSSYVMPIAEASHFFGVFIAGTFAGLVSHVAYEHCAPTA